MDDRGYTFWGTCKGSTKAGSPCKRTIVYANSFCYWHGGDSSEFMRERFEKIKAKALRRVRRQQRRIERLLKKQAESGEQSNQESIS